MREYTRDEEKEQQLLCTRHPINHKVFHSLEDFAARDNRRNDGGQTGFGENNISRSLRRAREPLVDLTSPNPTH